VVAGQTSSFEVELEPDRAYFWKIIAEDSKGGNTASEMRRIMTSSPAVGQTRVFVPFAAK
jgi:hypothetical protein